MTDCSKHKELYEPSLLLCTFNAPFGWLKFNRQWFNRNHFRDIEGVLAIRDELMLGATSLNKHNKIVKNVLWRAEERSIKFNIN